MSDVTIWEHQLFEGLSESQQVWLSERSAHKVVTPKSTIFQPDDLASEFYLIHQGKVKVEVLDGPKNWFIRDFLLPDDFFGINGLLGQPVHRAYARSLRSPVELCIFNNADLRRLMEVNFDFAEKILTLAAQKTIHLEQRTVDISTRSAMERLSTFITNQIEEEGEFDGQDWFYNSEITQEEIGAYIGTGRQTVTEILTELKAKNILTYNWGKFWVHDLDGLKELVLK
ncbi:MAG: Crp/Fnr family transcriptional regulator [Bacteroidota bacterium]